MSHQKPKKRFFNQDSFMGNKDRDPKKNSKRGGHTLGRTRCTSYGKQHLGNRLAEKDGFFACGSKGHKIWDLPNIKARGKEFNQAPQGGLDPNAPKKNHLYGMGARKGN